MNVHRWWAIAFSALLLGCHPFETSAVGATNADAATPADSGTRSSCRETFFDPFVNDDLVSRWDSVVPNGGQYAIDTTTFLSSPQSLRVSRPQGSVGPTLKKQATRSKNVCCEFGMQGVGGSNVFMLQGAGGNYAVFLSSISNALTPAEVLSVSQPELTINRVLTPLPAPYAWTKIRIEAVLPQVGKGTIAIYYEDATGATAPGVVKDQLGLDGVDLGFDTVLLGILASEDTTKSEVHFDDFGCTFR